MAIQARGFDSFFRGDLADFEADTRVWPIGVFCIVNDGSQMRIGDGLNEWADLKPIYEQNMHPMVHQALLGATTPLTAVTASTLSTSNTYTDAAVLTAINALATKTDTLRSQAEARLDAIETKVDAVNAALVTAGMEAAS